MALPTALPAIPKGMGMDETSGDEYLGAMQNVLQSLQQRTNPNWFSVAGQLLDPGKTGNVGEAIGRSASEIGRQQERQYEMAPNIALIKAQLLQKGFEMNMKKKGAQILGSIMGTDAEDAQERLKTGNLPAGLGRLASGKQVAALMYYDKDAGTAVKTGIDIEQKNVENAIKLLDSGVEESKALSGMSPDQRQDFKENTNAWRSLLGLPGPKSGESKPVQQPGAAPEPRPVTESSKAPVIEDPAIAARKAGVPVLSGLRDNEKQQQLYDNWVASGKQGTPVARPGTSKHEVGNALDVDTAKLTDENRQWLRDNGFAQPAWATDKKGKSYDPNHWERVLPTANQPAVNRPTSQFSDSGLIQRNDETPAQFKERVAKVEEPQIKDAAEIASGINKVNIDSLMASSNDLNELKQIANYPKANKIFAPLQLQGGENYAQAVTKVAGQLLDSGVSVTLNNVNAKLGLPFEKVYQNINLTPTEKNMATRAMNIIASQVISNIIANKTAAFGGSRVTNYQDQQLSALNANMDQLPKFITGWATRRQVDNAALLELSDSFNDFLKDSRKNNKVADPRAFLESDLYRKELPNRHTEQMNKALKLYPYY